MNKIYIQAKRWKKDNVVGRPDIQIFVCALSGKHSSKGVFITTSKFSKEARLYSQSIGISLKLIDGKELVELMYDYSVGVSDVETLVIKKIDNDYFEE